MYTLYHSHLPLLPFQEDSTFSLHLERNYKWTASTSGEKEAFIACLWRQTQKFPIYNGTGFTNVDKERLKGGGGRDCVCIIADYCGGHYTNVALFTCVYAYVCLGGVM